MTNDASTETSLRQEVESLVAEMGGKEAMLEGLREFEEACIRMNNEREVLIAQYPNKHVAMNHEGALFVGDTREDLYAGFESHGVSRDGFVIEYLDTNPETLIL